MMLTATVPIITLLQLLTAWRLTHREQRLLQRRSVLMLILELGIWVLPLTLLQPLDVYGLECEAYMVYWSGFSLQGVH
jgi:hypothetical protein